MKVVLLRHGESAWNRENRFTGWTDVDLSPKGEEEAREAARLLTEGGFGFDLAFTSYLRRAIRTLDLVLEGMDRLWIPVEKSWRLNERHYGALQGLDKGETAARFGEEQVKAWRRSYAVPPPPLAPDDPRNPAREEKYAGVDPSLLPLTESLKETVARVLPYWTASILPQVAAGRRVLVAAHGNSLRALVKHLDGLTEEEVVALDIPTGIPLVYEFDDRLRVLGRAYLGDAARVRAAMDRVAAQGKAKAPG